MIRTSCVALAIMCSRCRRVAAKQRELVSVLVRDVVAQSFGQGRERGVEVRMLDTQPVELGE